MCTRKLTEGEKIQLEYELETYRHNFKMRELRKKLDEVFPCDKCINVRQSACSYCDKETSIGNFFVRVKDVVSANAS